MKPENKPENRCSTHKTGSLDDTCFDCEALYDLAIGDEGQATDDYLTMYYSECGHLGHILSFIAPYPNLLSLAPDLSPAKVEEGLVFSRLEMVEAACPICEPVERDCT